MVHILKTVYADIQIKCLQLFPPTLGETGPDQLWYGSGWTGSTMPSGCPQYECVSNVCVNGGVWEAGGTVRLDPLWHQPTQTSEHAGSSSHLTEQVVKSSSQEKQILHRLHFIFLESQWSAVCVCESDVVLLLFAAGAHLSLSRARGWLEGSLSAAEICGDQGLNAEGLCLGWMQLSPWKKRAIMWDVRKCIEDAHYHLWISLSYDWVWFEIFGYGDIVIFFFFIWKTKTIRTTKSKSTQNWFEVFYPKCNSYFKHFQLINTQHTHTDIWYFI